ncbi:hypothetical protein AAEU29_13205 [Pseudoalteromonas sp. SSM20]|uniref:hypothetical protein n=1 Tax=Pseudoalteromonas sp. SSM20 TaxID=3139394 RepID=UPI003BACDFE4
MRYISILLLLTSSFIALAETPPAGLNPQLNWDTRVEQLQKPIWECTYGFNKVDMQEGRVIDCAKVIQDHVDNQYCDVTPYDNGQGGFYYQYVMNSSRSCPTTTLGTYLKTDRTNGYCPDEQHPNHTAEYEDDNGTKWCLEIKLRSDDCPEPSANDYFISSVGGGQRDVCYNNPDGTQCKITTDTDGSFFQPYIYGSQESVECLPDPEPDPDPDPDPEPDPDPTTDPDPDPEPDPDPTTDPDPLGDGTDADNTDATTEIQALNQVNDNLSVINDNMREGNKAISDRLDQLVDETQNSNSLLSDVKQNTFDTNGILSDIKDAVEKEPDQITMSAERKTGGLNDLFSAEKLAILEGDRDTLKQDLKDYYSQIQTEIKGMFDLQINATGVYENRTMTLKGQTIEYGMGRFATFWQQLAPIVLFIFSCLALYAVLGGVRA